MKMITNRDKLYDIDEEEYGRPRLPFKPVASGKTIELNVPKVTGNIAEIGNTPVNGQNIFINAPDCKPLYERKVIRKNTISATMKQNCVWLDKLNGAGVVPITSLFVVEFTNRSLTSPYATTK